VSAQAREATGADGRWQPLAETPRGGAPAPPAVGQGYAQPLRDLVREVRPAAVEAVPVVADRPLLPLGQFRDTFIIAIDDDGIAIIDQHVAHERVLFEQVMERLTTGTLERQQLLMPIVIELPPAERQALAAHGPALDRLGFDVEEFGGDSVRIAAVPALVPPAACETAVRALAQDLDGLDQGSAVDDALRRIAATTACHAAVKANDRLTPEKMVYILDELRRTAHSSVCPHGRPVILRLSRREIEKRFERT
jgi:DNA mismatch repair protein MutL